MGCFLGCFRNNDDCSLRCHLLSKFNPWKKRVPVVDRNQYAFVVSSEEIGTPSEKAEREIFEEDFDGDVNVQEKLRQEAKFLKTCGAILETPIEIRKASVQQSAARINWDEEQPETLILAARDVEPKRFDDLLAKDLENIVFEAGGELKSCQQVENNFAARILDISPQAGDQSPYPTPVNLADGMQTPATVNPAKLESFRNGRIKAEFVYPLPDQPLASLNKGFLRPPLADKSLDEDRSILRGGTATAASYAVDADAHWKQWDGNGIPNSTTKYKEDQRVSWHATPFEVRLEKALSDEKIYPPRKIDGSMAEFEKVKTLSDVDISV